MSKQISRNEIAEEGVLDNLLKPLKELLKVTDSVDAKLKDTAKTINESFKFSESSKGLRELEVNLQKTNKLAEQKKKVQQDQTKVQKQLANATERLNSLSTEEAKELLKTREAIRSKTNELKASGNAYKELNLQARNLKNESKDLGAQLLRLKQEGKENSQQYQELAKRYAETSAQAAKMDKDLKNLDKTVGDNFRNVGNYESAFDALNKEVAKGGMDFRDLRKRIQEYQSIAVKAGRTSPIGQKAIKEASKLQDEMDTLTQQTKALADDGANLKAALQFGEVVASSYQSVMAAQQLLGVESERVLEIMAKIQAVQVIINGLNKIRNSLDKASILTIKAKTIANKAYNFVLGAQAKATKSATVSTKALNVAMRTLPILAIIGVVTALVAKWDDLKTSLGFASAAMNDFKKTQAEAIKQTSDLKAKITEMSISFQLAKDGVIDKEKALKDYNDEFGETLGFADDLNEAEAIFNSKTEAYIKSATLRAQAQLLIQKAAEEANKALLAEQEDQRNFFEKTANVLLGAQTKIIDHTTAGLTNFSSFSDKIEDKIKKSAENRVKTAAESQEQILTNLSISLLKEAALLESEYDLMGHKREQIEKRTNKRIERENNRHRKRESDMKAEFLAELSRIEDEYYQRRISAEQQEINAVEDKYFRLIQLAEKYGEDTSTLEEARQKEIDEIQDKYINKREKEQFDKLQKDLEKQNKVQELSNIKAAKTQEEFDNLEFERQKKHLENLIKLRKQYGEDVTDLNIQLARLNQKYNTESFENVADSFEQTVEQVGNAIADTYSTIFQRQIDELKQQEDIARQVYGTLEKLAAEGNIAAQESLAEQIKAQQDAQREQIRLQQRQADIEKARQVYAIIQSQLDAGKSPGQAIAEAGGYMTAIQGLIQSLPSFYEGTEDTGKASKALDSKGGRLAVLHNNERVLTAEQNKHLQGIPNPMIPVLVNKALDSAGNSYDLLAIDELRRTRQAIEKIPQSTYQLESAMGQIIKLVATHKTGNSTTKNIFK